MECVDCGLLTWSRIMGAKGREGICNPVCKTAVFLIGGCHTFGHVTQKFIKEGRKVCYLALGWCGVLGGGTCGVLMNHEGKRRFCGCDQQASGLHNRG